MGTNNMPGEVYDVEAEGLHTHPADEVSDLVKRIMAEERWLAEAAAYALGRLHYEASPVAPAYDVDLDADQAETPVAEWENAARFGFALAYQRMMIDWQARNRRTAHSLPIAWANYIASGGGTIDSARDI